VSGWLSNKFNLLDESGETISQGSSLSS